MPSEKKRGRPRSTKAQAAILAAARDLLADAGPARLTVEAVAARAGVGKPTIYRYWANARELAMAALMPPVSEQPMPAPDNQPSSKVETTSALAELKTHVRNLIASFATTRGRQTALMLATAERDSEMFKAFRNQVVMKGREQGRAILERAISTGEIAPSTPLDTALDVIYGPVFFRLLMVHAPLTRNFADEIVSLLKNGLMSDVSE